MSLLSKVRTGRITAGYRIGLFGPPGIGKSTFAANAPNPIFADPSEGTKFLDTNRVAVDSWEDLCLLTDELIHDEHDYQTFVIDELGEIERMLWDYMCRRDSSKMRKKLKNIEDYGYAKGYTIAVTDWMDLTSRLKQLVRRGMNIILIGHADIVTFKNPEAADYDRYQMKLHKKAASVLYEFVDALLFARLDTRIMAHVSNDQRHVGKDSGKRIIQTEGGAAFDAKNRFDLPPTIPLDYGAFHEAALGADPKDVRDQVMALLNGRDGDWVNRAIDLCKEHKDDVRMLKLLLNRCRVKAAEEDEALEDEASEAAEAD